jgi:hypothetical protein
MNMLDALRGSSRGAAAAEMALVTPLLLGILFGSVELGNYFYDEHKLVKAVRDGARYAARQRFANFNGCTGSPPATVVSETRTIVRKGTLDSTSSDLLPNWDDASTSFSVTMSCLPTLSDGGNTMAPSGIYAGMTSGAPSVTVTARLPYRPLIGSAFGFSGAGAFLNATQHAAVGGL